MKSTAAILTLAFVFIGAGSLAVMDVAAQSQSAEPKPAAPKKPEMLETEDHSAHKHHEEKKEPSVAEKYFTDVTLLDQDGNSLRFYNDVLKGKVVVINAMFTSCTGVCPPMNKNFEKIQEAFGDRIGKDVFLVSISVDPTVDTPERLKQYSKRFNSKAGWLFLTGKRRTSTGRSTSSVNTPRRRATIRR